jgi:F420-dependent oxidoreductase-like protein
VRVGMQLQYASGFKETVANLLDYERAGLDIVFVPEAYSFDGVSQLGFLAAKTSHVQIASGILNTYSRTPTLLGMTAAGLDYVSDGRFCLGLGASGPQVIEGFHGIAYGKPLARTREVVEICRQVWRREPVEHDGNDFHIPLTPEHGGSGLGKALKLINHPLRDRIPMFLAALGPKNIALAAELFEGWEPLFYYPEGAEVAFGAALESGLALRDPSLGPLEVFADTHMAITTDDTVREKALQRVRAHLALYIGGMGAKGKNFYNDLAVRYGFADAAAEVQELYLAGHKQEAQAALPEALVTGVSLIGDETFVQDRLTAFARSGVTTVNVVALKDTHDERVADVELVKSLI